MYWFHLCKTMVLREHFPIQSQHIAFIRLNVRRNQSNEVEKQMERGLPEGAMRGLVKLQVD